VLPTVELQRDLRISATLPEQFFLLKLAILPRCDPLDLGRTRISSPDTLDVFILGKSWILGPSPDLVRFPVYALLGEEIRIWIDCGNRQCLIVAQLKKAHGDRVIVIQVLESLKVLDYPICLFSKDCEG
jgi:hypothetical protein